MASHDEFPKVILKRLDSKILPRSSQNSSFSTKGPNSSEISNSYIKVAGGFQCKICTKIFAYYASVYNHVKFIHLNPNSFKCSICERTFNHKYLMDHHILRCHTSTSSFVCDICNYNAVNEWSLKLHISHCLRKQSTNQKMMRSFSGKGTTSTQYSTGNSSETESLDILHQREGVTSATVSCAKEIKDGDLSLTNDNCSRTRSHKTKTSFRNKRLHNNENSEENLPSNSRNSRSRAINYSKNGSLQSSFSTAKLDSHNNDQVASEGHTLSLECDRCNKTFSWQSLLTKHYKLKHSGSGDQSSSSQPIQSSNSLATAEATPQLKAELKNQCHLCFVVCWTEDALTNHLKRHEVPL